MSRLRRTIKMMPQDLLEAKAHDGCSEALLDALTGRLTESRLEAKAARALSEAQGVQSCLTLAMAVAGLDSESLSVVQSLAAARPKDTILQSIDLPVARAILDIHADKAADAVQELKAALPFERTYILPAYIRGLALLAAKLPAEAIVEFKKVTTDKGAAITSVLRNAFPIPSPNWESPMPTRWITKRTKHAKPTRTSSPCGKPPTPTSPY